MLARKDGENEFPIQSSVRKPSRFRGWPGNTRMRGCPAFARLFGDHAALWECDFNERAGIWRAFDIEIGAISLGKRLG